MSKRPRSHQLEQESLSAFLSIINGLNWQFEKIENDYGFDGQVTVFDLNGKLTNLEFKVQLKATDASDNKGPKSETLLKEKYKDYSDQLDNMPLLMVRYHAGSKKIYAKWFHENDLYYSKKRTNVESKSCSFCWEKENLWTNETPNKILKDVISIRKIKNKDVYLPIGVKFIKNNSSVVFLSHLFIKAISLKDDIFDYTFNDENNNAFEVNILEDEIRVGLVGSISGVVLHNCDYEINNIDNLMVLIRLSLLLVSSKFSLFESASEKLLEYIQEVNLTEAVVNILPEVVEIIGKSFIKNNKTLKIIDLVEFLFVKSENIKDKNPIISEYLYYVSSLLLAKVRIRDKKYFKRVESILISRLMVLTANAENQTTLGCYYYSLGNFYRSNEHGRLALKYYRLARTMEPQYKKRGYYFKEIGGAYFVVGQYRQSVFNYQLAKKLGEDVQALLSDAQLYCGNYRESLDGFSKYLESQRNNADDAADIQSFIWIIKHYILSNVLIPFFGDSQKLKLKQAEIENFEDNSKNTFLKHLVDDNLNSLLWFNLAVSCVQESDFLNAFHFFLTAACLNSDDIESWCNVILLGMSLPVIDINFLEIIFCYAYSVCSIPFIEKFLQELNNQPNSVGKNKVINIFMEHIPILNDYLKMSSEPESFIIRMYDEEKVEEKTFLI